MYVSEWKIVLFKSTNLLVKMWSKEVVHKCGEMGGL